MNDPIKQYREEHEREHTKFERTINENLTIIIGQNWRMEEKQNLFAERAANRLERLDERITEAHKDITELQLSVATKNDLAIMKNELLDAMKQLLQQKQNE
jgi:hypothetical protein